MQNTLIRRSLPIILVAFFLFVCLWGLYLAATYSYSETWQAPLLAVLASIGTFGSIYALLKMAWEPMHLYAKWIAALGIMGFLIVYVDQVGHFMEYPSYTLWSADFADSGVIWLTAPMAITAVYLLTFGFKHLMKLTF